MPISNFPAALQPIIQLGYLEREFEQALRSRLGYRAIADRMSFSVGIGETLTKTRAGLKSAVTSPIPAASNTNLDNGLSATVRINDRGPFVEGRIIDLSRAAAEQIDMVGTGVARVSLTIESFTTAAELFAIQVGAFGVEANAEKARKTLEDAGFVVTVEKTSLGVSRVSVRGVAAAERPAMQKKISDLGFANYLVKKEKTEAPQVAQVSAGG